MKFVEWQLDLTQNPRNFPAHPFPALYFDLNLLNPTPPLFFLFLGAESMGMASTRREKFKFSSYSLNFIDQTAHFDHKARVACVFVRLLLHRRSAADWAECVIYAALVLYF